MNGKPENDFDALEAHLAGTLKPVAPSKAFVQRLRQHVRVPPREEIASRLRDWQTLFVVFGSVISGALVILTVARAMFHLFGRRS